MAHRQAPKGEIMTPEELDAIRERAEAASPGPWRECGAMGGECCCGQVWSLELDAEILKVNARWGDWLPVIKRGKRRADDEAVVEFLEYGDLGHDAQAANARFVAHARTDIPALLQEIARLNRAAAE